MLPRLYQIHFQKYLKLSDYLFLEILINLTQSIKQVNLEKLATSLPLPILFESRRKKIQRFLSLLQQLGLKPGISFDLRGVKMTKTKQVAGFDWLFRIHGVKCSLSYVLSHKSNGLLSR